MTGQKYKISEAEMQVDLCMKKLWRLSGFEIPKEEEDSCCAHNKGTLARLGSLVGAAFSSEHKEHKDAFALCDSSAYKPYKGWKNIPMACLKMLVDHPYVADQIKYDLLKWEYAGGKKKRYEDDRYLGAFAGLTGEVVRLGQDKEAP